MHPAVLALGALLAAAPPPAQATAFSFEQSVGLAVVERIGSPYLVISNALLAPGTEMTIVDLSRPLKIVSGRVGRALPPSCPGARNVAGGGTCYSLSVPPGARLHWGPHIAVMAPADRFKVLPSAVEAYLEGEGAPVTFRVCTGAEGLHFTMWRGAPLRGKRVWHRYYTLGFELEESCKPEEMKRGRP